MAPPELNPAHRFRLARSIARAMSAAIWPWLARARISGGNIDHHGDRPLLVLPSSPHATRSGGTTSSPRQAMIGTSSGRSPEPAKPPPW